MSRFFGTYRWFVYLLLIAFIYGCGSGEMHEDRSLEPGQAYEEEASEEVEETSAQAAEYVGEEVENEEVYLVKKWKNKAKQQLESIEDLVLVLKDPELDPTFRIEIEKELKLLYTSKDSVLIDLMSNDIKFKNFKTLKVENGDTMSLQFKNNKEVLKAKFIVVSEVKEFGTTTEVIERLHLVSIEIEE